MPAHKKGLQVLRRDAFQIPANITPVGTRCIQITIPDDDEWEAQFYGAIKLLTKWNSFQNDTDRNGTVVAQIWRDVMEDSYERCNVDCDCLILTPSGIKKFHSDGHGGGTFEPYDPRTDGTVPPPWPIPPAGQTGDCLAAANIAGMFKDGMVDFGAKLTAGAVFFSILVAIEDWLALALGPVGIVVEYAASIAAALVDAGAVTIVETFDPSSMDVVYHQFQCAINCHAQANGTITAEAIDLIKFQFGNYLPGPMTAPQAALWTFFTNDFLDSQGPNGLTLLGNKNNISSADCSDCDCTWCHEFDFRISDYGFILDPASGTSTANWVAGVGWVSTPPTTNMFAILTLPSTAHFVRSSVKIIDMGSPNPGSGGGLRIGLPASTQLNQFAPFTSGVNINDRTYPAQTADNLLLQIEDGNSTGLVFESFKIYGIGTDPFPSIPTC